MKISFNYPIKILIAFLNPTLDKTVNLFRKDPTYSNNAENIVNNLSSTTSFLIWVDTKNFKTNIFQGAKDNWKLLNSYSCSIGKPSTPTPKGTFKVGIKGLSFGEEKGYKCRYYTQIVGNYLFHSIIYNLNGTIRDGRLGKRISDGCVRLALLNAKWIYDNVPKGTTIYIS
ncbi:L,D-transpeptidase [Clostridium paridis]|uniref:L,D-transpeptidase n=1 Tax=Clostridium paridis TaxID=2803863 RepID=A0A937K6I0_9CLOT|nr:L,D-transpeptidase [Clostridium paridis]MBL4933795.1 L,D-transpeptidase [Clostridium paridis]